MEYQDFTIDVRSAEGGKFEATVVEAPLGDHPQVPFVHPIEEKALEALLVAFDRPGKGKLEVAPPPGISPHEIGRQLYSALFRNGLADLFFRCCQEVPVVEGRKGIRLRLKLRFDDPEADYLASLPWDTMCYLRSHVIWLNCQTCPSWFPFLWCAWRLTRGSLHGGHSLKFQTSTATPAEPRELPWG